MTRQVGNKYAFLLEAAARILSQREFLMESARNRDLVIPGSQAVEILLADETLPQLVASTICYGWHVAAMKQLKGGGKKREAGELSVPEAQKEYETVALWLKKLQRFRSKLPSFLPPKSVGMNEAEQERDATSIKLVHGAAVKMLETFGRFSDKDADLDLDLALDNPGSNDFVEGSHATFSHVIASHPNMNPDRAAQLAMGKQNAKTLRKMGLPIVPPAGTIQKYQRDTSLAPAAEAWGWVYRTTKSSELRTRYRKMSVQEVRNLAEEYEIDTSQTKPEIMEDLIHAQLFTNLLF